jgi:hypothetical protein
MLEEAATGPAATCSNRRHQVRLQHNRTGGMFLLQCQQSLKFFSALADIAKIFLTPLLTGLTIFIAVAERG